MTAESASTRGSVFARARIGFRRWRRNRPFWGGLFMLLSGVEMLYAGNEDIGNLQIHLGVPGFQSYLIPLFLLLCGALVWATPAQRTFYGIIGVADAIYSLVGTNLGGFIIGFLLGILGGGLTVAWVPVKRRDPATTEPHEQDAQESQGLDLVDGDRAGDGADGAEHTPAAGGSPLHDTLPTATTSPLAPPQPRHADPAEADGDTGEVQEGKQGRSFPGPRHAADERGIGDEPGVTGEANRSATRFRWSPRTAVALIAALSVASIGIVTLQPPTEASAEACANPALTQLLGDAKNGRVATKPGASKHTSTRTSAAQKSAKTSSAANGSAMLASAPEDGGPLGPTVDLIGHLLAGGTSATPDPTPSTTPTTDPTPTADPTPSASPSADPTPTVTPSPTVSKAPTPTSTPTSKPSSTSTGKPAPPARHPAQPSPSPSTICAVTKLLTAASGQPVINDKPSTMTADVLTCTGCRSMASSTCRPDREP